MWVDYKVNLVYILSLLIVGVSANFRKSKNTNEKGSAVQSSV